MFRLFLIVLSLLTPLFGKEVGANRDFQLWFEQDLSFDLKERLSSQFEFEERFAGNASLLHNLHALGGLSYAVLPCFEIMPAYQQIWFQNKEERWASLYHPLLELKLRFSCACWEVINRHRTGPIFTEHRGSFWSYRTRFKVIAPWVVGGFRLWAFDEIFFLESQGFEQNRFAVGGSIKVGKCSLSPGYMLRHVLFEDGWRHHHIFRGVIDCAF